MTERTVIKRFSYKNMLSFMKKEEKVELRPQRAKSKATVNYSQALEPNKETARDCLAAFHK